MALMHSMGAFWHIIEIAGIASDERRHMDPEDKNKPEPEPAKKQTEPEPEPAAQQPTPQPSAMDAILKMIEENNATMAALTARVDALANQGALNASINAEPGGGKGEPAPDPEPEPDYPEIDLDEIGRMIGDY